MSEVLLPRVVISKARVLIKTRGWRNKNGPLSDGPLCVLDALCLASGETNFEANSVLATAANSVRSAITQRTSTPFHSILKWNDEVAKSAEDVDSLLMEAEARCP